jgi:hypothetical protein
LHSNNDREFDNSDDFDAPLGFHILYFALVVSRQQTQLNEENEQFYDDDVCVVYFYYTCVNKNMVTCVISMIK